MNVIRTILFTLCFTLLSPLAVQAKIADTTTKSISETTPKPESGTSPKKVTNAPAPSTSAATFDDKVQREADDKVRRAEGELSYLGAAYAAAFFILAIFLWFTRRGQQRLADEVKELQSRIDDALTSKPENGA